MKIRTVLFDIGNVLTHDGHETYLTDANFGLMKASGLTKEEIFAKTAPIFRKYAVVAEADEELFWKEISQVLDFPIHKSAIEGVKFHIQTVNPEAKQVFEFLKDTGVRAGVISNNTPFFYPVLAQSLDLENYVPPELSFLSHMRGRLKYNGLFEIAASELDVTETHILDDRAKNIVYAKKLGFGASQYNITSNTSLLSLVKEIVGQES